VRRIFCEKMEIVIQPNLLTASLVYRVFANFIWKPLNQEEKMEITENQIADLMQLKEKMEVMELEYRYVRSVDSRDWQTSVDLFHSDGQLYLVVDGERDLVGGKPEIEEFFREIADRDFIFGRHSISNPIVTFEGDTASFSSYFHTTFIHNTFTKVNFGYYDDKVEKEKGEWKLMEKQIVVGWSDLLVPLKDLKQDK